jgi:pimeloyl-ACP methyl ester carboxylesterase
MQRMWLSGGTPGSGTTAEEREATAEIYAGSALKADPMAFFPAPGRPDVQVKPSGRLKGGRRERLSWTSGYQTWDPSYQGEYDDYGPNNIACAEAWRHEEAGHPTLICVHSWMTGNFAFQRQVYAVRRLYRSGLNVVLFMLPFHGPRTPPEALFGGQLFPGTSPQRTNEAFGQTLWDLRALMAELRADGSGPVGVMGMSLGGYTAAVLASVEADLDFAIPMIPMVSLADLLWMHGAGHPTRKEVEASGVTLEFVRRLYSVHSPLELEVLLPAERLMIVGGEGDRICPPAHIDDLWEHWGRPRRHSFPGGHLAQLGRRQLFSEVIRFIEELPRRESAAAD